MWQSEGEGGDVLDDAWNGVTAFMHAIWSFCVGGFAGVLETVLYVTYVILAAW